MPAPCRHHAGTREAHQQAADKQSGTQFCLSHERWVSDKLCKHWRAARRAAQHSLNVKYSLLFTGLSALNFDMDFKVFFFFYAHPDVLPGSTDHPGTDLQVAAAFQPVRSLDEVPSCGNPWAPHGSVRTLARCDSNVKHWSDMQYVNVFTYQHSWSELLLLCPTDV